MHTRTQVLAVSLLALSTTPALAASSAQAVTDLNLRAGPGPQFEILTVIDAKDDTAVEGCLDESNWCKVSYEGNSGWAYGDYLSGNLSGESYTPIIAEDTTVEVGTVTYENEDHDEAIVGTGAVGAVAGGLLGGPPGAVAGAILGGATGGAVEPETETISYVRTNQTDPVYVNGEVVAGVVVPESVELNTIPNSDYTYAYLNNVPVLVDAENRTVVHIVR